MSAALKRASALLLAAALLAVPASAAGSAGDPLVSRSYAESWGEALAGEAAEAAAQELREAYDAALAAGVADFAVAPAQVRSTLAAALDMLATKRTQRLPKKHGNMAL